MPDIFSIEQGARLKRELSSWIAKTTPRDFHDRQFQQAFRAFDKALIATITYMKSRKDGQLQDSRKENELTELWAKASRAVATINPKLSDACMMKGLGWTDPENWEIARRDGIETGIEDMQKARSELNRKLYEMRVNESLPGWFPIAGVAFAAVTVGFLMYLLLGPVLDPQKKTIFDVLMAFCAASSGAFLGGTAAASGEIPFLKDSPFRVSAAGGIGIFVVVYLVLHMSSVQSGPARTPSPQTPDSPDSRPLYVGHPPSCTGEIVTDDQDRAHCANTPLGRTIPPGRVDSFQELYVGTDLARNGHILTIKPTFRDSATEPYGYTSSIDVVGSKELFAVIGCNDQDGEVTTNPTLDGCKTTPIGYVRPW
jgi:hypothetical protein